MNDVGIMVAAQDTHGDADFAMHVEAFERCAHHWPKDISIRLEMVTDSVQPYDVFCKGIAINEAARKLAGDCRILVCTDIDIMIPPVAIRRAVEFHSGEGWSTLLSLLSRDLYQWDRQIEFGPDGDWADPEYGKKPTRFNCLGSWMSMSTEHWLRVGGFNEEYSGWGSDDWEVRDKCALHGIPFKDEQSSVMHLAHAPREYQKDASTKRNHQLRTDPARRLRNFLGQTRKPDFIVVGAQKSASTSVAVTLDAHPDIYLPKPKPSPYELHHFDHAENYDRGGEYYFSWFPRTFPESLGQPLLVGEKTPNYLEVECLKRIHQTTPDTKIIGILRDPVERAYSAMNHLHSTRQKWGGYEVQYGNRLDNEFHRQIVDRWDGNELFSLGEYFEPVKLAMELFDHTLFIRFSDWVKDPVAESWKLFDFLGVPRPEEADRIGQMENNAHRYEFQMRPDDRDRLNDHYQEMNDQLFALLGWDGF